MSIIESFNTANATLTGAQCVSCEERTGFPMYVKSSWQNQRYIIPVCADINCRARARLNWDNQIGNAEDAETIMNVSDRNTQSTGSLQSTEVINELYNMMAFND